MVNEKGIFYTKYIIEKSLRHHAIEWLATILTIAGAVFNAFQKIEGFYLFVIGNILWVAFAIKHKHWGLFIASAVLLIIDIIAIKIWL